jgi:hypothetical protein
MSLNGIGPISRAARAAAVKDWYLVDASKGRQEQAAISTLPLTAQVVVEFVVDFTFEVSRTDSNNFFARHQSHQASLRRSERPRLVLSDVIPDSLQHRRTSSVVQTTFATT